MYAERNRLDDVITNQTVQIFNSINNFKFVFSASDIVDKSFSHRGNTNDVTTFPFPCIYITRF